MQKYQALVNKIYNQGLVYRVMNSVSPIQTALFRLKPKEVYVKYRFTSY